MEMVNGYVFLDLTKSNVYSKALKVLGADKPVVIKDGSGSPYFVDFLTLDGTNVVITKGGKTITIANDNTITNVGDIQNHLYIYNFRVASDYGCNILLPFKLKNDNINVTGIDDLTTTIKEDLTKLFNFYKNTAFSGYSSSSSEDNQQMFINESGTNMLFGLYYVVYQDDTDDSHICEISKDFTSVSGDDLDITLIKQLF